MARANWEQTDERPLKTTSVTDPWVNEAVSTTILDTYSGVIITTTTTGNAQTLQSPTNTTEVKRFSIINNDTSTDSITVNGVEIWAWEVWYFIWDWSAWTEWWWGWWTTSPLTTKWDVYTYSTEDARLPVWANWQVLTVDSWETTWLKWTTVSGTWDVTASSTITDNTIVRWDWWAKWVQQSWISVDDSDNVTGLWTINTNTLPTWPDTLVWRNTTDTLTNKTIDWDNNTLSNIDLTSDIKGILPVSNWWTWSSTKNFVDLTTAQSVAWIKTFSVFPVTPSSAPTTDYQVANKKYVDNSKIRRLMFVIAWTIWTTWTGVWNTRVVDDSYTIAQCNLWYWTAWNWTLTVDINKWGTTLFSTTKPSITSTNQSSIDSWTLTTTSCVSWDVFTLDIDAVPATTSPVDLYIELILTK